MRDAKPPCLDTIGGDAFQQILVYLADNVQDLLRFSRVSKRYSKAVYAADEAWKRAFDISFGVEPSTSDATASTSTTCPRTPWLERYKTKFLEAALRMRQKLAARRLKVSSAVQTLEQEVYRLEQNFKKETRSLHALRQKFAALEAAKRADMVKEAHEYWAPVAVTRAQGSVVMQLPQNADELQRDMQESIAISNLECEKLKNMLVVRKKALETAKTKLGALQP